MLVQLPLILVLVAVRTWRISMTHVNETPPEDSLNVYLSFSVTDPPEMVPVKLADTPAGVSEALPEMLLPL